MTLKRIHVNQHVIKRNSKIDLSHPEAVLNIEPPLTCKNSKQNVYGFDIQINDHTRVVYSPENPLPCGAKVWIETTEKVTIRTRDGNVEMS